MTYYLQNRWKLKDGKLVYYGIRYGEKLNKNVIKLSGKQRKLIAALPCELTQKELKILRGPIESRAVLNSEPKITPKSLKEAKFCKNCCGNDFIIAGLEFGGDGLCAMCESADKTKNLKSVVPVKNEFERSKKSRFDVAVFYTGGKDSTYLLYYLSEVKNLRVLALTWEIPYASDSALKSIENAKKKLDKVEFVTRKIGAEDMRTIYKKLYELNGNTCACPSLAYVMFYPLLVEEKVPYFVAGNEPAQLLGLYYNRMAPEIAYRFADSKGLNFLVNLGRVLTFRPPLKRGQFHTLTTMKQLAFGTSFFVKKSGYRNELVENVTEAIHSVPNMVKPLKKSIRRSSRSGNIPAFVQVDFDEISGGKYDWTKIKDLIADKCGWVAPEDSGKGLHTSCKIERCKEYSQFIRFYNMESTMIPFSALEISLAGRNKNITREQAVYEIENTMGFSLEEIPECEIMKGYFKDE
ncbi:MAG: hypothetical protein NC033_04770 [Clostridiales bacterium]|nr:hypothetical protein [Clostridiales bacterium]